MLWWNGSSRVDPETKEIVWPKPSIDQSFGYGRVRNQLIRALQKYGIQAIDGGPPPGEDVIQISHTQPFRSSVHRSTWKRFTKRGILYTTFESGSLPPGWVQAANTFDAVWTTSEWCKKVFEENGVERPVYVIHHGIDPGAFPPMYRPLNRKNWVYLWQGMAVGDARDLTMREPVQGDIDEMFVEKGGIPRPWWLDCGKDPWSPEAVAARNFRVSLGDRKQAAIVREAFVRLRAEKRIGSDARLVIKWLPSHSGRFEVGYDDGGDEALFGVRIDHEEYLTLLQNSDVSVNPTRCEGFGMQPLEHAATGLPVMVTGWSGVEDWLFTDRRPFADLKEPVVADPLRGESDRWRYALGMPIAYTMGRGFYSQQTDRGWEAKGDVDFELHEWATGPDQERMVDAHPRVDAVMDLMEWTYHNREEAREMGLQASRAAHALWTWDVAVRQILESLIDLGWVRRTQIHLPYRPAVRFQADLRALPTPPDGMGGWHPDYYAEIPWGVEEPTEGVEG